jgi:UDP-N-acetylmuramoyl-tripeptide--D-alanyl-D-alanine ligase
MRLSLADMARATGGTVVGDPDVEVTTLGIDTRSLEPGAGFVAIVAERDGHEFVADAVAAGATAVIVSRAPSDPGVPMLVVPDTGDALVSIGGLARTRLPDRVVGITGSVGKTSTKDLLAAILRTRWSTAASERSFNNELGVPLTLISAPDGTEAVVAEIGARGIGHIAALAEVVRPTAGVVTSVAEAHLEMFGSIDDVATAKGELVEALPESGVAVLNADDERVLAMADRASCSVLTYGVGEDAVAEVRATNVVLDDQLHPRAHLCTPWGATTVTLAVHGAHQVANAVAAAACGLALGVDIDDVADTLSTVMISGHRMWLERAPSGLVVLDDSYNANPMSTRAALDALAALPVTGDRVAVLGTMAELGPEAQRLHRATAQHAASLGIRVISVDAPEYGIEGADAVPDIDAALALVARLGEGDAVLVKGSRVAALERVAAALSV